MVRACTPDRFAIRHVLGGVSSQRRVAREGHVTVSLYVYRGVRRYVREARFLPGELRSTVVYPPERMWALGLSAQRFQLSSLRMGPVVFMHQSTSVAECLCRDHSDRNVLVSVASIPTLKLRYTPGYSLLSFAKMTMDRCAGRVRWSLYRDAACLEAACILTGSLNLDLVRPARSQMVPNSCGSVSEYPSFSLDPTGIQLILELQQRVWDLLERKPSATREIGHDSMSDDAVPIAVEDLSLGARAAEWGLQDSSTLLYCKLQLDAEEAETRSTGQEAGWFTWKLARAGEYRARGNEAFKQESYSAAVHLYKRALAWLEPPASRSDETLDATIAYSTNEMQLVNPVAVACYANVAACYSKLDGDGDLERCTAAATSALELDESHVKARYRRSQAYVTAKEFDLALADLTKLCEVDPDNKLFRSALSRAKTAKTLLRKKQQCAFANLFDE